MMKNKLIIIASAALALFLSGCLNRAGASAEPSPYQFDDFDTSDVISIETDKAQYDLPRDSITYTISNHSDVEVYYGISYSIEMQQDNKWYQLPFKESTVWIAIAHKLDGGDSQSYEIDVSLLRRKLSRGNYRLVKQIGEKMYFARFSVI